MLAQATASTPPVGPAALGLFFCKVGALTFGGGSTMIALIALIQQQMVHQFHWLTPQDFIDGLALGHLTLVQRGGKVCPVCHAERSEASQETLRFAQGDNRQETCAELY